MLNAALFEALELGLDKLAEKLIDQGADPSSRHSVTHVLPHSMVLARQNPNTDIL